MNIQRTYSPSQRILVALALYVGLIIAGMVVATGLTLAIAAMMLPKGSGAPGDGILLLPIWMLLLLVGICLGVVGAYQIRKKRSS
jgi:hypothetical protein